jgi:hypothetical protein
VSVPGKWRTIEHHERLLLEGFTDAVQLSAEAVSATL